MEKVALSNENDLDASSKDHELLSVIHKACVFSFIGASFYALYAVLIQKDLLNLLTTLPFLMIFLLEIIFYRLRLIERLKHVLVLGLPLLISGETLCMGGDFSQSAALLACLAVGYVFFVDNKRKVFLIGLLNILVYCIVLLYLKVYGPLFGLKDDPFDEIVVLVISAGWLYFLLNKHDRDKNRLIQLLVTTQELERFTNIASHDLKSPLRNIASFLGLIERQFKRGDTTNLLENLEYAQKGAVQMHNLIEGILEISKVNQNVKPEMELVDLNSLLNNAISNLNQDIKDKKANVSSAVLPHVHCNPTEFTLLFQNLLQNAIKYNQSNQPFVEVSAAEEAGQLKISFTDNGIGIEQKYYDYIFDHFKRLHSGTEYVGTGLGLSLCKKIVQKHGGKIVLESELAKGSTFTLVLPKGEVKD
jgi:signal transduction histidine kinase